MSQVFKAAQPALLYLVPFTLFPLFGMAWLKVDFKIFLLYCQRNFPFRAISGQCGQTRSCMFLQPSTRPSEIWADQTCSSDIKIPSTKYPAFWSDQVCSSDIKTPSTRQSEIRFDQACSTVIKIEAIWDRYQAIWRERPGDIKSCEPAPESPNDYPGFKSDLILDFEYLGSIFDASTWEKPSWNSVWMPLGSLNKIFSDVSRDVSKILEYLIKVSIILR